MYTDLLYFQLEVCLRRQQETGGEASAGAHRVLPASGLQVLQCPEGVCLAPR